MQEALLSIFTRANLLRLAPHVFAIVLFAVLSNAFYSPFRDGYKLRQGDVMNYRGMSKEVVDYQTITDEKSYWTGSMFCGMPTFQITGQSKNTFDLSRELWKFVYRFFSSSEIAFLFLSMLTAYILALAFGVSPWLAMMAGVGMGLGTINILYLGAGHRTKVKAISVMPGVLAGVIIGFRRSLWWGMAISALFLVMHIGANHLQMTYYLIYLVGALGLTEVIFRLRKREYTRAILPGVLLLISGIGAAIPNAANLMSTREYAAFTTRGEGILDVAESGTISEAMETAKESGLTRARPGGGDQGGVEKINVGVNRGEGLGDDYILQYSMSKGEWLAIMCPNLKGGHEGLYWGEQYFSAGAFYFGAILVALFFAFLIAGKDRLKWPMLALTFLVVVLSWREMTGFMRVFIDYVPLFQKFRDTKMMLVLVQIMVGMGAVLALKEMAELGRKRGSGSAAEQLEIKKRSNLWKYSLGGILVAWSLFYAVPHVFFDFFPSIRPEQKMFAGYMQQTGLTLDEIRNEFLALRLELFRKDVLRTIGLLVLTAFGALALLYNWIRKEVVFVVFLIASTGDLWQVDRRYCNEEDKVGKEMRHWMKRKRSAFPFNVSPQLASIKARELPQTVSFRENRDRLLQAYKDGMGGVRIPKKQEELMMEVAEFGAMRFETSFRVLNYQLPYTDAETSYFVQSIGGYHGAKLQRIQDYIEVVLGPERSAFVDSAGAGKVAGGIERMIGHRMLNMKYIMLDQLDVAIEVQNPSGPAWFVDSVEWANSPNDEIIKTKNIRSFQHAVVHEEFREGLGEVESPGESFVQRHSYSPEAISYDVNSEHGGLVVFSEMWYPMGWKIEINEEPAELVRANYLLRAVRVPPGEHQLVMKFEPVLQSGEKLANAGGYFMLLFILFGVFQGLRETRRRKLEEA